MLSFVSLLVSTIGFGQILRRIDCRIDITLSLVLGFFLIPIISFFMYFLIGQNLQLAFKLTMLISLIGIVKQNAFKSNFGFSFLVMITTVVVFLIFGKTNFVGSSWDELSHWVLHPKQIILYNVLLSPNFLPGSMVWYLPGLAFLNVYAEGVWGIATLNVDYIYSQLVSSMLLMGFFSFVIDASYKDKKYNLFLLSVVVSMFFLVFRPEIYPVNNLIEITQGHAILVFFVLIYYFHKNNVAHRVQLLSLSIAMAYAYLLKASNINLLPVLLVYCYTLADNKWNFLKNIILTSLPVLVIVFVWKFFLNSSGAAALPSSISVSLLEQMMARSELPVLFFKKLFTTKHFITALVGSLFFYRFVDKKFTFLVYFYFTTYALGLLALYFFVFSEYEALKLASMERYIKLALVALKLHAIFGFTSWLSRYSSHFQKKYLKAIAVGLLVSTAAFSCYARFNTRSESLYSDLNSIAKFNDVVSKIYNIIKLESLNVPKLLFIEQGGDGLSAIFIKYKSLDEHKKLYSTSASWSFNEFPRDVWTQKYTYEQFENYLAQHEVIVIYKADEWLVNFFLRHVNRFSCNDRIENKIFVKKGSKFICF